MTATANWFSSDPTGFALATIIGVVVVVAAWSFTRPGLNGLDARSASAGCACESDR
jgi:hypothetical protein